MKLCYLLRLKVGRVMIVFSGSALSVRFKCGTRGVFGVRAKAIYLTEEGAMSSNSSFASAGWMCGGAREGAMIH